MSSPNSYKSILKGTSLFGGVQIFQILINLVRGKFVALFLGPEGMGALSMFNSAHNTLLRISSLGLGLSVAKEVAANKEDEESLSKVHFVSMALLRLTALLGAIACLLLAPWLSKISFGSTEYTWQFLLLSVVIFFSVGADGKSAILQGLHKVKLLSMTSIIGALSGLLIGVPLYYFFGEKGIVPAMVVLFVCTYSFYSYGVRKALPAAGRRKLRLTEHRALTKKLLVGGIVLLTSSLINTVFTYGINIFIRTFGNLDDVGLFNAANSITLQYTGMIFAAMSVDYFPRLAAVSDNLQKMKTIVCRQLEIVALIITPLAILLVASAPLVIRLLLSVEFLQITPLMRWLGISIILKALAYPLGYILFAKDNKRMFFLMEGVVGNVLYLGLSLVFYYFFGLMGLGYAAVAEQGCSLIIYLVFNAYTFRLKPDKGTWIEITVAILFGATGFCASIATEGPLSLYLLASVFMISAGRSFMVIRNKMRID